MNKDAQNFIYIYDLKLISKTLFYGKIKNYEVNLYFSLFDAKSPLRLSFTCILDNLTKEILSNYISNCKNKMTHIEFNSFGFVILTNGFTVKKAINDLYKVIDDVVAILIENKVPGIGYCPFTSIEINDENSCYINKDGYKLRVSNGYAETYKNNVKEAKSNLDAQPKNYLKGFYGALIGALAGAILSVVLALLGLVSAWCSIIAVFLSYFLYKKFGGKSDYMMIIIIALTTISMMLLSMFIVYIINADTIMTNSPGFTESGFEAFNYLMNYDHPITENSTMTFKNQFTYDMVLTGVYSLLGTAVASIDVIRRMRSERLR